MCICECVSICVCVCASVCRLEDDQHFTVYMIKSEDDVWKSYRPFPFMGQVTKLKLWGCCQVVLIVELSHWSLNHFLNTSLIYLFPLKRDYTEFFWRKRFIFILHGKNVFVWIYVCTPSTSPLPTKSAKQYRIPFKWS